MFLRKDAFENFVEMNKEPKKTVCCNECKYQKSCLEKEYISYVTYPNGEKGYARIGVTHHFSNTCNFPIDEY